MKRKRYSEEQIISILKQNEAGRSMVDPAREHGIAQNTLYRWTSKSVVDDFSRECLLQTVDFSIGGQRLTRELDHLAERRGLPGRIVMEDGPGPVRQCSFGQRVPE